MNSWSDVEAATVSAKDSTGSALEEQGKFADSIQGKINALNSAWSKFATRTIDENVIKSWYDVLTAITNFGASIGGLTPVIGIVVTLLSSKLAPALSVIGKVIKSSVTGMFSFGNAVQGVISWIGLLTTAISVSIAIYNNWKIAQENAAETAISKSKELINNQESLNDLISQYNVLSKKTDWGNDERTEAKSIQKSIVDLVGDEAAAIDLVNGKLDEQTKKLEDISIEYAKSIKNQLDASVQTAENTLVDLTNDFWTKSIGSSSNLNTGLASATKDFVINYLSGIGSGLGKYLSISSNLLTGSYTIDIGGTKTPEDIKKMVTELTGLRSALIDAGYGATDAYKAIDNQINSLTTYIDNYDTAVRASLQNDAFIDIKNQLKSFTVESKDDLDALVYKTVVATNASTQYAGVIKDVVYELFGYTDASNNASDANDVQSVSLERVTAAYKSQSDAMDDLQSAYSTVKDAAEEYQENGNISVDTLQSLLDLQPEYLQYLLDENGQFSLNAEALDTLTQAMLDNMEASVNDDLKTNLDNLIEAYNDGQIGLTEYNQKSQEYTEQADAERAAIDATAASLAEKKDILEEAQDAYDDQSSALDTAQSAYETLTSAIDEYNKTGVLSIDTLQELLSLSPEYLQMFFDQSDALGTAESAITAQVAALKEAKREEILAAAAARILAISQSTVGSVASGATGGVDSLGNSATTMGNKAMSATPKVAGLKAEVAGLYAALGGKVNIDWANKEIEKVMTDTTKLLSNLSNLSVSSIGGGSSRGGGGGTSKAKQQAEAIKDAYDSLLSSTMNMLKQKTNDRIDQLEDELDIEEELYKAEKQRIEDAIDGYKEIIDAKKESLQLDKDEKDFNDEITDKNKKISEIQNRLLELSFDTSESSKAEQLKLQEELSSKQKDLSDTQYDRSVELSKNALDNEYELYKSNQNAKIDLLDEAFEATKLDYEDRIELLKTYLEEENTIRSQAMDLISGKTEDYYDRLFNWNQKYGEVSNDILQSIINKSQETISTTSSSSSKKKSTKSASTTDGSSSTIAGTLASLVGKVGGVLLSSLGIFHEGLDSGFVGDVKGNETFVKALKGEAFVTEKQQDNFVNKILPSMLNASTPENSINCESLLTINVGGNLDPSSETKVVNAVNTQFGKLNKILAGNGLVRKANSFA